MSLLDRVLIAFVLGLSLAFAFVLDDIAEHLQDTRSDVTELREELHDGFDCEHEGQRGECRTQQEAK